MKILRNSAKLAGAAAVAARALYAGANVKKQVSRALHPQKEDVVTMKKSTLIAILVFFSAGAGALGAAFLYLRRREAELDEYEQLLFSEDFSHEEPSDDESEADETRDEPIMPEPHPESEPLNG